MGRSISKETTSNDLQVILPFILSVPHLEASFLGERARGRWGAADGTAGGLFEMEAWAGHEADTTREGMKGETRSYSSGEPVGRAGGMLICACICVCMCVSRITERRATCADRGILRCHFLLAGVCVSQSGRSAAETAPAYKQIHTLELIYTCKLSSITFIYERVSPTDWHVTFWCDY